MRGSTDAAVEAGAEPVQARAVEPVEHQGQIGGYRLSTGAELRGDFVIGADGATSRVADAAGLVDSKRVLWGFAIRTYLPQVVDRPAIVFWEPTPRRAFPGYGWVFPGAAEGVNVGIGLGTLADRKAGAKAQRALPLFLEYVGRPGSPVRAVLLVAGPPAGRVAQDGHGGHDARQRQGPSRGRCGRSGQSVAG